MSGKITRISRALGGETTTGTATTADATGTVLIDSAATFLSDDIQVGDSVENTTDVSTGGGVITSIDSDTQITHTALTGGTDDEWGISDAYAVNVADEMVYDMENAPASYVAPKRSRDNLNIFWDVADGVVSISGDENPVTGGTWHVITQANNWASLPWPFSGIKVAKGAGVSTFTILGESV